jgi:hypothetical protein
MWKPLISVFEAFLPLFVKKHAFSQDKFGNSKKNVVSLRTESARCCSRSAIQTSLIALAYSQHCTLKMSDAMKSVLVTTTLLTI